MSETKELVTLEPGQDAQGIIEMMVKYANAAAVLREAQIEQSRGGIGVHEQVRRQAAVVDQLNDFFRADVYKMLPDCKFVPTYKAKWREQQAALTKLRELKEEEQLTGIAMSLRVQVAMAAAMINEAVLARHRVVVLRWMQMKMAGLTTGTMVWCRVTSSQYRLGKLENVQLNPINVFSGAADVRFGENSAKAVKWQNANENSWTTGLFTGPFPNVLPVFFHEDIASEMHFLTGMFYPMTITFANGT